MAEIHKFSVSACQVVIRIYNEKIGNRLVAPLNAGVDVYIVDLVIVLDERRPEYLSCKGKVYPWSDQIEVCIVVRFRQPYAVVREVNRSKSEGMVPLVKDAGKVQGGTVEMFYGVSGKWR